MKNKRLQWHPAFCAALQIDLEEDTPYLHFVPEYNLTRKPLQIDIMVEKEENYDCRKNLAKFFRRYNIIEYKNPEDYFSVNDFYQLLAYGGSFQSNTEKIQEILPDEITLTIVCGMYPRELVKHLHKRFNVIPEKKFQGIYYIDKGLAFPLQIVINRELDSEEYVWLSRLRSNLKPESDIDTLSKAYRGKEKDPLYETAMDLIMRANKNQCEEAKDMCSALRELFADELEEARNEGIEEKQTMIVRNLLNRGMPDEDIMAIAECNIEFIEKIRA